MKIAIYPGSFDPITKGHLDVIQRASTIFDKVIVVIMRNERKKCLFTEAERLDMISHVCAHLENVECEIGNGLTVRYAKAKKACAMIRGIRATSDYEYEVSIGTANMMLNENIETMFLMASSGKGFISSSYVKDFYNSKIDITSLVPEVVLEYFKRK